MRLGRAEKQESLASWKPNEGTSQEEGDVNNIKYCVEMDQDTDKRTPLGLDVGRSLGFWKDHIHG